MKCKILSLAAVMLLALSAFAQTDNLRTVEAQGTGAMRNEALDDALRNAIGMVSGVVLRSESRVENFELISDAINTNVDGYIKTYDVVSETKDNLGLFNLRVKASVTTEAMAADARRLANSVGGIRFLVAYDERKIGRGKRADMEFMVERVNQFLASKKYRYIEKARFDQLKNEAMNLLPSSDTTEASYVATLGAQSGAQFVILLTGFHTESKQSGQFGVRKEDRLVLDAKVYDNCLGEGLGTVVVQGPWYTAGVSQKTTRQLIDDAVVNGMDELLTVFTQYIGDWINNGTPFELRFYGSGTFRDMSQLRRTLQEDRNFGGQMEIVSAGDYQKLNLTFRNRPEDLADKVLEVADGIPNLKAQRMDVMYMYGRQINFAPEARVRAQNQVKKTAPKAAPAPAPAKKTNKKNRNSNR